jgi:hypothetical protein
MEQRQTLSSRDTEGNEFIHSFGTKKRIFAHLKWVYPTITPFLKGMHLTLDSWQPGMEG